MADCIRSVIEQTQGISYEIILVDNDSRDGSVELIKSKYPQVIIKQNSENIGFGRANNEGIRVARGKYLFLLNSDTLLKNNAVKIFYDRVQENPTEKIGVLGSYLKDPNRGLQSSYSKFSNNVIDVLKMEYAFLFPKRALLNKKEQIDNKKDQCVNYLVGADLFIPRKVIEDVGMFDPLFFMYFEEQDLQYRMGQRGYLRKIICGPDIVHLEGGTIRQSNAKRIMYDRSEIYFIKKYNKPFVYGVFIILYFLSKLLEFLRKNYVFKENIVYFKEVFFAKRQSR